jgi:hypothetical protein
MEKAGHRRLYARLGLAAAVGLATIAGPASAAVVHASAAAIAAQRAGCGFDGDPDASDFVVLAVILGFAAFRRHLRT